MTNEAEVYFALYGDDFDLDEVTRDVGLEPTSTHVKALPSRTHSTWKVSMGKIESDHIDIYEMSSSLVARLVPYLEKIANVKRRLGLEAKLQVVLWITTDEAKPTPAIGFELEVISFLNAVGASIDVDTYRN